MDTDHIPAHYRWTQLFAEKPIPLLASRHVLSGDFERHSHDFIELVLVTGGTGRHLSLSGDEPLRAGQGLILRPGTWHAYYDCHELIVYNCCFRLELLQYEFLWGSDDAVLEALFWSHAPFHEGTAIHRLTLTPDQSALCQVHLESLIALEQQGASVKLRHLAHFMLFLAAFVYPLEQKVESSRRRTLHQVVQQMLLLLEGDLAFPWTLSQVSRQVGLDPSYLVRLFKANLGMTPMAYLTRKRVEQAALLLVQTTLSIGQIGQRVGWPDPNHFARTFKAQMGMSATSYRDMCTRAVAQRDQTHTV